MFLTVSQKKFGRFAVLACSLLLLIVHGTSFARDAEGETPSVSLIPAFPVYKAILGNVRFWEDIYLKRRNNEVVVHDAGNPSRVYEVITLIEAGLPGARKINIYREEQAKKKYVALLKKLSRQKPTTREEKRIAALFPGKNPRSQMKHAAELVRLQGGQQRRFRRGIIRSGKYIDRIKKIFHEHNLPEDLAYLPMVESSYHNGAYSKVGATGIWQFTKTTGTRYLIIDSAVDERLDPITASRAAAEYLARSYKHLQHWPLAVTSYNYGLPGTIRAFKEFHSYSEVFRRHSTVSFQFASRNFYSEFVAAIEAGKKLERTLKRKQPVPDLNFKLKGYLCLDDLKRYFNLSEKQIKEYNPALRPAAYKGDKWITRGYTFRLPDIPGLQKKIVSFPDILYFHKQKKVRYHEVKKGQSAGQIAKRYGVSLKALKRTNRLNRKGRIYIGQQLLLPNSNTRSTSRWHLYKKQMKKLQAKHKALKKGPDGYPVLEGGKKHLPK
ncbi:transglycosylase SLT domain-containing protein [Desulforhopalus vacuolatus]|uniref:lytic transglycosylase domain-containing protein n=1 Tax=Desulforhopalus vacuolatus TaxID=40414 RepID=UPI0019658698|nr:lytic transglycosylase domain-containing protein [Desulforhopalus vacuolatus]MBM9520127.1 transglycosylase SLT domain-containing protein [Desulforhopalus vacuolatus]